MGGPLGAVPTRPVGWGGVCLLHNFPVVIELKPSDPNQDPPSSAFLPSSRRPRVSAELLTTKSSHKKPNLRVKGWHQVWIVLDILLSIAKSGPFEDGPEHMSAMPQCGCPVWLGPGPFLGTAVCLTAQSEVQDFFIFLFPDSLICSPRP